jgi:imidazole glycerol phosphate synthase glutamine amidotransferase subunit
MPTLTIVNTGLANTASVAAAFRRLGVPVQITRARDVIQNATHLVLPGVGAFGAGMAILDQLRFADDLRLRLAQDRPTLCICLGLQLLCRASEESPGATGLGVIDDTVTAFSPTVRTPQFGWNRVTPIGDTRLLAPGFAYFANSFRLTRLPPAWAGATAHHGDPFIAALERGNTLACQFHPELSGPWGLELLERWLASSGAVTQPEARTTPSPAGAGDGERDDAALPTSLTSRVIPCLDIRDGRVVKGVKFANLRDAGDPVEQAARYESQGADELVILDVSATPEGRSTAVETVRAVRAVLSIPLTVGGGVRTIDDALALLDAGADKVAVNSAAVERPTILTELSERVGAQCVVLAIDAARRPNTFNPSRTGFQPVSPTPSSPHSPWEVVTRSGTHRTGLDAVAWAARGQRLGAGEILLTSFDRDGTHEGYDTELLRAISDAVTIPIIASGGASSARHMAEALHAGADAVLAASIFHDAQATVARVKNELAAAGVVVRREPGQATRDREGADGPRPVPADPEINRP